MEGRPLYRTVAAIGLAAYALAVATMFLVGSGDPFFAVLLAVAVVGAAAAWSWSKGIWVSLVAAIALEVMTFWFVFPMIQGFPVSVLDSIPAMVGFVGVWSALIASILGAIRRNTPREFGESARKKVLTAVGIIAVLAIASTALTLTGKETVSDAEAAGATTVVMEDGDKFNPTTLEVPGSGPTKILVRNDDPVAHTFTIDDEGYDINEILGPGSEKLITFTPKGSGDVEYVCEFHSGMEGTLTVG